MKNHHLWNQWTNMNQFDNFVKTVFDADCKFNRANNVVWLDDISDLLWILNCDIVRTFLRWFSTSLIKKKLEDGHHYRAYFNTGTLLKIYLLNIKYCWSEIQNYVWICLSKFLKMNTLNNLKTCQSLTLCMLWLQWTRYSQTCLMWPFKGRLKYCHIRQVVAKYRFN